jgi:hypothetical protein
MLVYSIYGVLARCCGILLGFFVLYNVLASMVVCANGLSLLRNCAGYMAKLMWLLVELSMQVWRCARVWLLVGSVVKAANVLLAKGLLYLSLVSC